MVALPWAPPRASSYAAHVDALFLTLVVFTAVVTAGVFLALAYFCIKYRRGSRADRSAARRGNWFLEIGWTVIPIMVFLGLFYWGARLYFHMTMPPEGAQRIFVVGQQWMWTFEHPEGQRELNELHVPLNKPVELVMISEDVIHDLFIPAFRLHHDVLPGRYLTGWFQADRPGRYRFFCSQYCGTEHARMVGWVIVLPQAEYAAWLSRGAPEGSLAAQGARLFVRVGCAGCHGPASSIHAPDLAGIYQQPVHLQDGTTVLADDAYVRDSILQPSKQVVAGYPDVMPTFRGQLREADILELTAYIRSLGESERTRP